MSRFLTIFFLIATGLIYPTLSSAGVHPFPMILRFYDDQSLDFKVSNDDTDHVAYVSMQVEPYQEPGKKEQPANQKPVKPLDPRESGLLISPTKLVLPPGGSRLVRVRLIQPPGPIVRRYIVRVTPEESEVLNTTTDKEAIRAGVRVVIAYGVGVIVESAGTPAP